VSQDNPVIAWVIRWEKWIYRLAFVSLAIFTAWGIFVLFYPTDARTDVFGVMLLITLGLGVLSGMATVYSS
jgi:hypothetical protein